MCAWLEDELDSKSVARYEAVPVNPFLRQHINTSRDPDELIQWGHYHPHIITDTGRLPYLPIVLPRDSFQLQAAMWMVLQVLGALGGQQGSSAAKEHKRRRLQKAARDTGEDIVGDRENWPSPLSLSASLPSPVSLDHRDDEVMTAEAAKRDIQPPPQPRDPKSEITDVTTITTTTAAAALTDNAPLIPLADFSNRSVNSLSIYSLDQMAVEILKRTRAKTPCFWVGQLDPKPCDNRYDSAIALACEYQALLPPRTFTPGLEAQPLERTIRKIKGRQSLRQIVEQDESGDSSYSTAPCDYKYHFTPNHTYTSDCDTLVGSESPSSPCTPTSGYFPRAKPSLTVDTKINRHTHASSLEDGTSAGFQVCLDLLTEQLATGLFKKHPAEHLDRASGLQILLMIEAYESVLQHIRGEIAGPHLSGLRLSQLAEIEETLDHWVRALYSVYDRTMSNASTASFRSCRSSFSSEISLHSSSTME